MNENHPVVTALEATLHKHLKTETRKISFKADKRWEILDLVFAGCGCTSCNLIWFWYLHLVTNHTYLLHFGRCQTTAPCLETLSSTETFFRNVSSTLISGQNIYTLKYYIRPKVKIDFLSVIFSLLRKIFWSSRVTSSGKRASTLNATV